MCDRPVTQVTAQQLVVLDGLGLLDVVWRDHVTAARDVVVYYRSRQRRRYKLDMCAGVRITVTGHDVCLITTQPEKYMSYVYSTGSSMYKAVSYSTFFLKSPGCQCRGYDTLRKRADQSRQ